MARTNSYPARCAKCRVQVPAQAGVLQGPPWQVLCAGCAPDAPADPLAAERAPQADPAVRIESRPAQGDLTIRAAAFLGPEHFGRFRELTALIAEYEPEIKANVAPRERLLEAMSVFKEGGFDVILSPDLVAELQAEAEEARKTSAAASARIEELRARFQQQRKTLRIYQETGVAFLAENTTGALLADDPGTGKTIVTLASWPDAPSVLVVCPVNAIGVWTREIRAWRPELRVAVQKGSITRWPLENEVLLATYDSMRKSGEVAKVEVDGQEVEFVKLRIAGEPRRGTLVVADEGHRLAKPTSMRTRTWRAIVAAVVAQLGRGILLTGSPVLNEEGDLWALLEACGQAGSAVFGSRKAFLKLAKGGEATRAEYLQKARKVMLRRTKKEVMKELPPIQWTTIDVQIDDATRAKLDDLLKEVVAHAVEHKVAAAKKERAKANAGLSDEERVAPLDLEAVRAAAANDVQAAIDLAFDGKIRVPFELISRVKSLLATAKLPTALEVLDDLEGSEEDRAAPGQLFDGFVCDDPICFASAHVAPVEAVAKRPGWALIRGGVSADQRTQIVEKFQAGGYRGVALAIKAAGEALTLTRSSRMLINDPEWTPAAMDQLVSRIHRMGQAGRPNAAAAPAPAAESEPTTPEEHGAHVQVIRLVADHVLDRRIQEILDVKLGIVERVVEAAAVGVEHRAVSAAVEIEAALAASKVAQAVPGRRAPQSDVERSTSLLLLGSEPLPTAFLGQMRSLLKREGALTEKQWEYATKAVKNALLLRAARDAAEEWAARGIVRLAHLDPDHAGQLNGVGFNRYDGETGHALAARWLADGALPDDGWRDAVRLAAKYQRQIGPKPWVPLPDSSEDQAARQERSAPAPAALVPPAPDAIPSTEPVPAPPALDLAAEHALNPFAGYEGSPW